MTAIEVLRAGPLTTIQDLGRPGFASIGVPPSGAADLAALELGNRIVGNPTSAAALEATLAGPRLRFLASAVVALSGAETNASLAGLPAPVNTQLHVRSGDVLDLGGCTRGVRAYICIRGGIDVEQNLGSRSTDLLTGLGPGPLRDGDLLQVGVEPRTPPAGSLASPRDDWFAPEALELLVANPWRVNAASNRVGVRLDGPRLERVDQRELLSEGLVTGALQVPPSGQPILLLNDHPTTGGYPVLAVVRTADLSTAGQLYAGEMLRFALV
jgi:biotin-dependent carboxylase-like uncharacterized protein